MPLRANVYIFMGGEDSSQNDPSSREATGAEAWQCEAALGVGCVLWGGTLRAVN